MKVIFDEEQRLYFTLESKKQIQFLNREERDAYQEMAKKEEGIYYREIDREAFLYLNFRKYPKPMEQEIEAQFMQARKERAESVRQVSIYYGKRKETCTQSTNDRRKSKRKILLRYS